MWNLKAVCFSAAIVLSGIGQHANAAEPTIDQKIEALMRGIDFSQQQSAMMDQIANTFKAAGMNLPEAYVERASLILSRNFTAEFSNQKQEIIEIYKNTYTSDEVDAMYTFYSTPIGSQILDKNSVLAGAIGRYMTPKSVETLKKSMAEIGSDPEIQELIQARRSQEQ